MRFLTVTSFTLVGALGLANCVDEAAVAPRSSGAGSISASSVAAGGASSYVIQGTGNALPGGLAAAVEAAGGTPTNNLPPNRVAVAASGGAGLFPPPPEISGRGPGAPGQGRPWGGSQ